MDSKEVEEPPSRPWSKLQVIVAAFMLMSAHAAGFCAGREINVSRECKHIVCPECPEVPSTGLAQCAEACGEPGIEDYQDLGFGKHYCRCHSRCPQSEE